MKNKNFFGYLMQLFGGRSPVEIASDHGLSPRATDRYLIGLWRAGLVRFKDVGDRIYAASPSPRG